MTDRDFLELFHKIDDKFLEEARRDQRGCRISRQRIFNTLSTMAACMAIVIAAVLLISSFISSGQFALMNPSSPVQSDNSVSADAANGTSPEDSSAPVSPSDQKLSVMSSHLSFPHHSVELDLPKEDYYRAFAVAEPETVDAVFAFSVRLSDGSFDTRIPARMYFFADGQPIHFKYRSNESSFRDFTIVPETDYSLPISFEASADVNTISVVCIFFPGDAERQHCLIETAGNIYGINAVPETILGTDDFIEVDTAEPSLNFVTVTSDPDAAPRNPYENTERDIPADSAYFFASLGALFGGDDTSDEDYIAPNPHYIIALVNGKPVNVFDSGAPFCLEGYSPEKGLYYRYRIPEEYLAENSTLQIIALPAAVTSWQDLDLDSGCFGVV